MPLAGATASYEDPKDLIRIGMLMKARVRLAGLGVPERNMFVQPQVPAHTQVPVLYDDTLEVQRP